MGLQSRRAGAGRGRAQVAGPRRQRSTAKLRPKCRRTQSDATGRRKLRTDRLSGDTLQLHVRSSRGPLALDDSASETPWRLPLCRFAEMSLQCSRHADHKFHGLGFRPSAVGLASHPGFAVSDNRKIDIFVLHIPTEDGDNAPTGRTAERPRPTPNAWDGRSMRRIAVTTFRRGFAADLLQMQRRAIAYEI